MVCVVCACGKKLYVKATETKRFHCKYCNKRLKLAPDSLDADTALYSEVPFTELLSRGPAIASDPQTQEAHPQGAQPPSARRPGPPRQTASPHSARERESYWQNRKSGSTRLNAPFRPIPQRNWSIIIQLSIAGVVVAGILVLLLGKLIQLRHDFQPPQKEWLVERSGIATVVNDRTDSLRRKGIEFEIDGDVYFADYQEYNADAYDRIRQAVYSQDTITIGIAPEGLRYDSHKFWSLKRGNIVVESYEARLERFRFGLMSGLILPIAIGLPVLFGAAIFIYGKFHK